MIGNFAFPGKWIKAGYRLKKWGLEGFALLGMNTSGIKKAFPETQGRFLFKKSSISYSLFACINGKCIRIAQRCTVK